MAIDNGGGSVPVDAALARALYVERAKKVRWFDAPHWAWKHKVEGVFGQTKGYWLNEDETESQPTAPAFEVADGESVVIPLDWK